MPVNPAFEKHSREGLIISSRPAYVTVHGATPPKNREKIENPYEIHLSKTKYTWGEFLGAEYL